MVEDTRKLVVYYHKDWLLHFEEFENVKTLISKLSEGALVQAIHFLKCLRVRGHKRKSLQQPLVLELALENAGSRSKFCDVGGFVQRPCTFG